MPHVSDGGGVDLSSNDEIKVFHVEGEGEDEERSSSENLKELKSSLVAVAEVPGEEVRVLLLNQLFLSFCNVLCPVIFDLAGSSFHIFNVNVNNERRDPRN